MKEIHNRPYREFQIQFFEKDEYKNSFLDKEFKVRYRSENSNSIVIHVDLTHTDMFLRELSNYQIRAVKEIKYTLERYFMENFGGEQNGK